MAVETAADLEALFSADEFAVVATVAGAAVNGIFDAAYQPSEFGDVTLQGSEATLQVRASDVSSVAYGAAVVVDGVNYTLRRNEPDGTGVTTLILTKD